VGAGKRIVWRSARHPRALRMLMCLACLLVVCVPPRRPCVGLRDFPVAARCLLGAAHSLLPQCCAVVVSFSVICQGFTGKQVRFSPAPACATEQRPRGCSAASATACRAAGRRHILCIAQHEALAHQNELSPERDDWMLLRRPFFARGSLSLSADASSSLLWRCVACVRVFVSSPRARSTASRPSPTAPRWWVV
jgi:hypothetical protein